MIYTPDLWPPAEATGATLRIALPGPPALVWGGQPFAIARRQARAVLYRIADAANPVPRAQLGYLLWPEIAEPTARRNLTVLLTQIWHPIRGHVTRTLKRCRINAPISSYR